MPRLALTAAAMLAMTAFSAGSQAADVGYRDHVKQGVYEDIAENVKDAIIKRGYVIDYTGQFNAMLERTAADTGTVTPGGNKSPYKQAQYMQFCPAKLTHEAVNASTFAIANCPISIYTYETKAEPGKVHVGYRLPVTSPSKRVTEVNNKLAALLEEIVKEATK